MKLLIENKITFKFGCKVIVLDARFKEILTIPPIEEEQMFKRKTDRPGFCNTQVARKGGVV